MDVLLVTDRAGVLMLADGSALGIFGVRAQDVGKSITIAAAAVPEVVEGCNRSLAGQAHAASVTVGGACFDLRFHPLPTAEHAITGAVVLGYERSDDAPALARTAALLAEAQRLAHVGSWEWNVAPNVVTWSDEMHRIYGIELGQFDGTYEAFLARVHPDDRQHTQNVVLEAYRTAQPFIYNHRIVRRDGTVRMLHTRGAVSVDAQGKPLRLGGSCWDITAKWEAEQSRERSYSLLRAALESTADGLLVVDLEGVVTTYNQRLLDLWGLSRTLMEHADFEDLLSLVHEQLENGEACMRRVVELRARPAAESFDALQFRDGRVFERYSRPQHIGDRIVGRVWSYRDVADREGLLRRALFLSEAGRLLASLDVEEGLEGVARLALPSVASACAVDLFSDGGGPRRLLSISLDPAKPLMIEVPREVFAGRSLMWNEASGSYVVVPVMARNTVLGALTFSVSGERRYVEADLVLFRTLASRVGLALENARLYRRAGDALAARDEFLSIAAHEIRGPVTSLHLAAQELKDSGTDAAARLKLLQIIEREDRRLSRFVDELLDVGRVRAGGLHFDLAAVDLGEVVRDTLARLAPEITRSRSSLSVTIAATARGRWDRLRLEQVVVNLLSNAIKFGLGRPIELAVTGSGGVATLLVRDHGIGIAEDRQERIFEPFERAVSSRQYGGLGLGLYIVRRIVEGLGGTVTVQSQADAGATFIVELRQEQSS